MFGLSRAIGGAGVLAVAALVASGCGQTTEDAEAQLCADLSDLRSSIADLHALTADSSLEEFDEARQNVRSSYRDAVDAARNVSNDRADDVEDAADDFMDSIDDIDDDSSLEDAEAQLAQSVETFRGEASEIFDNLGCAAAKTEEGDSNG